MKENSIEARGWKELMKLAEKEGNMNREIKSENESEEVTKLREKYKK